MEKSVVFDLDTEDGIRRISIEAVHQFVPATHKFATGVFSLNEGETDLGEIVFDDNMHEWEYTCMGNLKHREAKKVARFIKHNFKTEVAE
jgi:phage-related protein